MRPFAMNVSLVLAFIPIAACAQGMSPEEIIRSAVAAGPSSISDEAAVMDWDLNEIDQFRQCLERESATAANFYLIKRERHLGPACPDLSWA